jgi:hypothetical protein
VGTLEEALAFRVALSLWRLQRVAVYEAATATAAIESVADEIARHQTGDLIAILVEASSNDLRQLSKAEEELDKVRGHLEGAEEELAILQLLTDRADDATLVDGDAASNVLELADSSVPRDEDDVTGGLDTAEAAFLVRVGVPEDELDAPWDWQGWTAGMVRRGITLVAAHAKYPADKLLSRMVATDREYIEEKRHEVRSLTVKAQAIRRRAKAAEDRARLYRLLPDASMLEKLSRYEAHLSRQLSQALHELERLKAARDGAAIIQPAVVDVTFNEPMLALGGPSQP